MVWLFGLLSFVVLLCFVVGLPPLLLLVLLVEFGDRLRVCYCFGCNFVFLLVAVACWCWVFSCDAL